MHTHITYNVLLLVEKYLFLIWESNAPKFGTFIMKVFCDCYYSIQLCEVYVSLIGTQTKTQKETCF